jgi:FlaA1/EpsC-like NDP-sugar epimerase
MKQRMPRYIALLALWLLTDIAVFVGTYALSYFVRVGWIFSTDFPFERFLAVTAAVAPLWLITLMGTRSFALTRKQRSPRNAAYIFYAAVVGVALFALTYYFTFGLFFSRRLLLYALAFSAAGTWIWHMLFEQCMRSLLHRKPVFRALIIGVTRESKELIRTLNRTKSPVVPVAVLDGRGSPETAIDGVPVKGKLNKLEDVLIQDRITHLVQCADLEQSLNLLSACRQHGITYMLLPSVLGIVERDDRVTPLEGYQVTAVNPRGGVLAAFFR